MLVHWTKYVGFSPTLSNSQASAWWHYLPGVSVRSHNLRVSLTKTALTNSDANCKSYFPYFWPAGHKSGVLTTPSQSSTVCWNSSQSSGECFTYYYPFIVTTKWKRCIGQGMKNSTTYCIIPSIYVVEKDKTMRKGKGQSLSGLRGQGRAQSIFRAVKGAWYYNGGYMLSYICQNP